MITMLGHLMGWFQLYETKFVSGIGDHDPEQDAKQNMSETTNQQLYLGYINPGVRETVSDGIFHDSS